VYISEVRVEVEKQKNIVGSKTRYLRWDYIRRLYTSYFAGSEDSFTVFEHRNEIIKPSF
jgi:hypothetical protein